MTSSKECGKIAKLSSDSQERAGTKKDFEKSRKKYLTNSREYGKIVNVPRQSGAGRVPCKLNNVTNEKHQSSASGDRCLDDEESKGRV